VIKHEVADAALGPRKLMQNTAEAPGEGGHTVSVLHALRVIACERAGNGVEIGEVDVVEEFADEDPSSIAMPPLAAGLAEPPLEVQHVGSPFVVRRVCGWPEAIAVVAECFARSGVSDQTNAIPRAAHSEWRSSPKGGTRTRIPGPPAA
jgi:hypothetical protein